MTTQARRRLGQARAAALEAVAKRRPAPAPAPGTPAPTIQTPEQVKALQGLLNQATSQRLVVDGVQGPKTREAVRFLQCRLDLPATGLADPLTLVLGQARIEDNRRRRAAPRRFLLDVPLSPVPDAKPRQRQLLMSVANDMFIPRMLEEGGLASYEPETLACFLAALDRASSGVVLDVGANIGVFAVLAATLSDWEVVAFEPTPELAGACRQIAEANNLTFRVEELALGRETGSATFYLSDVTDTSNSLAGGFRPSTTSLVVPVERLDEWCTRTGIVPDLIKIDTETTEPDVLAGGQEMLRKHRPWLLCEVLPGKRQRDLVHELEPLNYTWYHIKEGKPLVATVDLEASGPDRNWLFTPEPLTDDFRAAVDAWRVSLGKAGA